MMAIYLMEAGADGPFKIGFTAQSVWERLAQIQTGCPFPVSLLTLRDGCKAIEKAIHIDMQKYRLQGEWFVRNEGIVARVNELPEIDPGPKPTLSGVALREARVKAYANSKQSEIRKARRLRYGKETTLGLRRSVIESYASCEFVAAALQRTYSEYGAGKRIAAAAGANTRTAQGWRYGQNFPRGQELLALMADNPDFEKEIISMVHAMRENG